MGGSVRENVIGCIRIVSRVLLCTAAATACDTERIQIFNGEDAQGKYREVAFLDANPLACSGVLVASNAVLTVAHCVCGQEVQRVVFGDNSSSGVKWSVARTESFETCDQVAPDSLAVAILDDRVTVIPPATVAMPQHVPQQFHNGTIVGFGRTETGDSGVKKYASVPVLSRACDGNNRTSRLVTKAFNCRPGWQMVAGNRTSNIDTCEGDSGGPFLATVPGKGDVVVALTEDGLGSCGKGGSYNLVRPEHVRWLRVELNLGVKVLQ